MEKSRISSAFSRIGRFFARPFTFKSVDQQAKPDFVSEYELFKKFEARWTKKRSQLIKTEMMSYFFRLESAPGKSN